MIVGYIGSIGTGKTMNAARDAIQTAERRGAVLVSNIRLRGQGFFVAAPDEEGRAIGGPKQIVQLAVGHEGIDLEHLRAIIDAAMACGACDGQDEFGDIAHGGSGCLRYGVVILLDEVGILMPARFWQSFPIDLIFELSQSRKSGADFFYTAQDVEQVDAVLRRLTQYCWMVKAFPVSSIERREKGKRPWFFMLTKWKVKHIETAHKSPLSRTFKLYRRKWERVYSTDELVRPPERLRQRANERSLRLSHNGECLAIAGGYPVSVATGDTVRQGTITRLRWAPVAPLQGRLGPPGPTAAPTGLTGALAASQGHSAHGLSIPRSAERRRPAGARQWRSADRHSAAVLMGAVGRPKCGERGRLRFLASLSESAHGPHPSTRPAP